MENIRVEIEILGGKKLRIVEGDLTGMDVDAIVNAANEHLQHGGGVAGAIVRRGGRIIQEESDRIGFVPVGKAAATSAGSLKARHVIHAVGPRWGEGDEDRKLESAVKSSLILAERMGLSTIAMPAISAGIFGFPKDRCARIIVEAILDHLRSAPGGSLKRVDVCLTGGPIVDFFLKAAKGKGGV